MSSSLQGGLLEAPGPSVHLGLRHLCLESTRTRELTLLHVLQTARGVPGCGFASVVTLVTADAWMSAVPWESLLGTCGLCICQGDVSDHATFMSQHPFWVMRLLGCTLSPSPQQTELRFT